MSLWRALAALAGAVLLGSVLSIAMMECGVPLLLRSVVTFGIGWCVGGWVIRWTRKPPTR